MACQISNARKPRLLAFLTVFFDRHCSRIATQVITSFFLDLPLC